MVKTLWIAALLTTSEVSVLPSNVAAAPATGENHSSLGHAFEKTLADYELRIKPLPPHSLLFEVLVTKKNIDIISALNAKGQYLASPPRVILDIEGLSVKKGEVLTLDHPAVKSVRIGKHPEFTRFVVDLKNEAGLNGDVQKVGSSFSLSFSLRNPNLSKGYHQPIASEPTQPTTLPATTIPERTVIPETVAAIEPTVAVPSSTSTVQASPTKQKSVTQATPTPAATHTYTARPAPTITATRTVRPSPTVTAPAPSPTSTIAPSATSTASPTDTSTPLPTFTAAPPPSRLEEKQIEQARTNEASTVVGDDVPLSALLSNKGSLKSIPLDKAATPPETAVELPSTPHDPLSHKSLTNNGVSSTPLEIIGPKDASQYLVDVRFDYQIQDRTPLLRVVMMTGADFNLIKRDTQTYQLIIPKAGIKSKELALPHFPPHDFVGFTLISPRYEKDSLIVEIGVDRGTKITAFSRGNEIWIRVAK